MVKSVLIYGADIWSLYEDDRRRIRTTEMDALRRSARISKLDRKTNEYVRGKMDAQDMILDEITRKQLIWCGHVERMDPTRLPKIMIHWKPEGRKKRGRPRRTWKDGIYTAMNERDLRMGEWNNRRQWNMAGGRHHQTFYYLIKTRQNKTKFTGIKKQYSKQQKCMLCVLLASPC
jgi:hypothetical protein